MTAANKSSPLTADARESDVFYQSDEEGAQAQDDQLSTVCC